ncbi:D-3-phosphoglycerate dehydrogenase [Antricoccus suffuscus]|uniref:D-3-phosphoglycerate dehydrogenase n=1 Tax=Antricoccus suffuscus TaxID=1629062 RepID=A0A2T1A776_9ACTN|nr:phosphoglycerate dehydrogenase [Antricoccus suffuscus]PRZ44327.1 D-3-phosphoglycerate dehydrogenase [Antricoccus suffuscus]
MTTTTHVYRLSPEIRDQVRRAGAGAEGSAVPNELQMNAAHIPSDEIRVLLLENIHPDAVTVLEGAGFQVETTSGSLSEAELIERVKGVHLLGIRSNTKITEKVLDAADSLLAIGAFCIGTNQIDLGAATSRGVTVFNAPYSNTRSVVELVIGEIISLARRLPRKNKNMHDGIWDKSATGSHEVRGRKLGIVGYGNIGSQLSVVAEALGFAVSFYDTADKLALGNARKVDTLDQLLAENDVITLHVDGRPGNAGLFGAAEFAKMKDRALFLNLSRGMVVDHHALREHVLSGHIAGAAVDVFPEEPKNRGDEFVSDLRGLDNVILTPHVGGSTEEAQIHIGNFVAGKFKAFVEDGSTSLAVNMPTLDLPEREGSRRIVHTHQNTPGVLAAINQVLADHGANIEGQFLGTRGDVGYVITDIGCEIEPAVIKELAAMSQTIRLRVLS